MHNTHILRVKADTPQDAIDFSMSHISEWGDDNNWRSPIGCIDTENKFHYCKYNGLNERYDEEYKNKTIQSLQNDIIQCITNSNKSYNKKSFDLCVSGKAQTSSDWYAAMKYCEEMWNNFGKENFNIFEDEYFEKCYDEFGITNISYEDDELSTFFVLIDMHS